MRENPLGYNLGLDNKDNITLNLQRGVGNGISVTIPELKKTAEFWGWLISVYQKLSMKQNFTYLQLTRLVYGETTKAETDMLLELAGTVPQIADSLEILTKGKEALGNDRFSPSDMVINRILGYSASSAPVSAS